MNAAFESLVALSVILDLANGLAEDKSLLTALVARELAAAAGGTEVEQWHALLAALLRHLGCTAFAHVEAQVAGDDIALRHHLHRGRKTDAWGVMRAVSAAQGSVVGALPAVLRATVSAGRLERELTTEACGAARHLADRLQLGEAVKTALDEVFERYDGRGGPNRRAGTALSFVGRLATTAHCAVVFALEHGPRSAQEQLAAEAGALLDPALARLAREVVQEHLVAPRDFLPIGLEAARRLAEAHPLTVPLESLASAFGGFTDLQAPFAVGHSAAVAALASRAAAQAALTPSETRQVTLAAHLHDLGQVAVPTSIWTSRRPFSPSERERARAHVYFTERVLAAAAPLADLAPIAAAHHERLDGSGYHRGSTGAALGRPARLLAVCDVLTALQEPRPHRPARSLAAAAEVVRDLAKARTLDATLVDAALAACGVRSAASEVGAAGLSERELEVLQWLARGHTNKEIAVTLGISPRTVQHHTIHLYAKLGVDTRAGAALVAVERGLLRPGGR